MMILLRFDQALADCYSEPLVVTDSLVDLEGDTRPSLLGMATRLMSLCAI
jgi:hypothetical protein